MRLNILSTNLNRWLKKWASYGQIMIFGGERKVAYLILGCIGVQKNKIKILNPVIMT